jgi:hypothetical protein
LIGFLHGHHFFLTGPHCGLHLYVISLHLGYQPCHCFSSLVLYFTFHFVLLEELWNSSTLYHISVNSCCEKRKLGSAGPRSSALTSWNWHFTN